MKCPSCGKRKGKRDCPGLRDTICSVCCGQKRLVEIRCPSDCRYLVSGNRYQGTRHYERRLRGPDAALFQEVLFGQSSLLHGFHKVLAHLHRTFPDFTDGHALEAVRKVLETCETEDKGIIYERKSPTPQVQVAIQDLTAHVAAIRQEQADDGSRIRLSEVITCLRFLTKDIESTIQEQDAAFAYLSFISGFFPPERASQKSIIVP